MLTVNAHVSRSRPGRRAVTDALTQLSEEEKMFRDAVLGFARERAMPLRNEMDERARMAPEPSTRRSSGSITRR